jgi:hypothetical protein
MTSTVRSVSSDLSWTTTYRLMTLGFGVEQCSEDYSTSTHRATCRSPHKLKVAGRHPEPSLGNSVLTV